MHHNKDGEFIFNKFLTFCRNKGIRLEFTNIASPQQNGMQVIFDETHFSGLSPSNTSLTPSISMFSDHEDYSPYNSDDAITSHTVSASSTDIPASDSCIQD